MEFFRVALLFICQGASMRNLPHLVSCLSTATAYLDYHNFPGLSTGFFNFFCYIFEAFLLEVVFLFTFINAANSMISHLSITCQYLFLLFSTFSGSFFISANSCHNSQDIGMISSPVLVHYNIFLPAFLYSPRFCTPSIIPAKPVFSRR